VILKHSTGGERFAHLLATWYQQTGTLVYESLETTATKMLWLNATADFNGNILPLDRSAILSAIASASYTFFQQ